MTFQLIVDPKGALLSFLKADPNVTALCPAERIKGEQRQIEGGQFAIAITEAGGPAPDIWAPQMYPRLDIHCWGANGYEAKRLYRTVRSVLIPTTRQSGFTAAGCQVTDVQQEGGPTEIPDPDGWPRVVASFVLTVVEVPV